MKKDDVSVIVFQKLAKDGVLLTQSYTTPKCSPSRAALMTGLYPWRIGMQRGAIERCSMSMSHCQSQLMKSCHQVPAGRSQHQPQAAARVPTGGGICHPRCGQVAPGVLPPLLPSHKAGDHWKHFKTI